MIYHLLLGYAPQGDAGEERIALVRRPRPALFAARLIGRQVAEKSATGGRYRKSHAPRGVCGTKDEARAARDSPSARCGCHGQSGTLQSSTECLSLLPCPKSPNVGR